MWFKLGRRFVLLALLGITLPVLGCGSHSATGPESFSGQYSLQTVNGAPLPFVEVQQGTSTIELLSDVFTVSEAGTFTELYTERTTVNGQVTTDSGTDKGTYTLKGVAVSFVYDSDGTTLPGSLVNGVLTFSFSGVPLVYTKQ